MQSSPVSALSGLVPGKAKAADGASVAASGLPVTETPDEITFDALLAQQTQLQAVTPLNGEAALAGQTAALLGQQAGKGGADAAAPGTDPADPSMPADLAALLANLIQAVAPLHPNGQAVASVKPGEVVAKPDGLAAEAKTNRPALLPEESSAVAGAVIAGRPDGKEAAGIAGTGKDLPLAHAKLDVIVPKAGDASPVQDIVQADANTMHEVRTDLLSQTANIQTGNGQATTSVVIEPRVGAPGWDGALGQKVVWLVNQRHQTAEMQLNPPNLGPVEIKLTINNDQASALFVSHHAAVRDAIESAIPRLREMLAENGIALGNAQVSAESFPRDQAGNGEGKATTGWRPANNDIGMSGAMGERTGITRVPIPGLVDTFA